MKKIKTTFSRSVALPGIAVLILLSAFCGLFLDSAAKTLNVIQHLEKEEIISDVLREYERFLGVASNEKSEILILDYGD